MAVSGAHMFIVRSMRDGRAGRFVGAGIVAALCECTFRGVRAVITKDGQNSSWCLAARSRYKSKRKGA